MSQTSDIGDLKRKIDRKCAEQKVHKFLELHPWMLTRGCRQLEPRAVISKFPLGANYNADFAYLRWDSAGHCLVLIEIEPPALRIFTKSNEFSSRFDHAVQQLADWEDWCQGHSDTVRSQIAALESVPSIGKVPTIGMAPTRIYIETRLIVGRRSDNYDNPRRSERWKKRVRDEGCRKREIRSWDGFVESIVESADYDKSIKCVRYRKGGYECV